MSLRRQIEDAEYEMREVQVQAELAHYTDRLVWSKLATVEELRKETATNRTALAEFSLGDNRSFVWLFVHGHVFFETLPSRGEIEKAVRKYLGLLSAGPGYGGADRDLAVLGEQSKKLVQMLFGHLFKEIDQVERVIIVPDGLLNYLPFEALIRNGRYLVEDHQISYSPSASLLGLWEDVGLRADSGNKMDLFALGDPVFEPKGRAIGSKRRGDRARFGGRTFPGPGSHLASLPRTRDEVEYIASLFPADRRKVIVGMASTEEAVKHEPLARYRRLHFATHSLIDEKLPSRSAVVLTLDNDPREDGFLEAGEISHLDLDCDLVVLSGCQTGKGQLLSGEGIVGLGRAFLCAGARSVVVSLWNVSDISTSHLMKNFYQHLVHGEGNAAALRAAKLQMLNSGRETRHPYYWAPFVVIGSP
jgi:CHAT domain-containing protein